MGSIKDKVVTLVVHNANTITKNTNEDSDAIDLFMYAPQGVFSLQTNLTGDGTADIEYLLSNDGVTYVKPGGSSKIETAFTKTSGPGSDGEDLSSFSPPVARYMKIRVTETGTANNVIVTCTLAIQV